MSERIAYYKKVNNQLNDIAAQLDNFQSASFKVDDAARRRISSQLESLRADYSSLKQEFTELQKAEDEDWEDHKLGVDSRLEELTLNLNTALSELLKPDQD
jgi:hypothetical protein